MTSKTNGKTTFIGLSMLLLTITVLLATGCRPQQTTPVPEPFSARRESEEGAIVAWSGDTCGYEPGEDASFILTIDNQTDQNWYGRYCLNLMEGQSDQVITTLAQRPFELQPGVGFSYTVTVQLPDDLDNGAYGLSLAVRRPGDAMVDLVPIQVGETEKVRRETTQQDTNASLAACPPVELTADQVDEDDLYQQTSDDSEIAYERVQISAAGLSLEVPSNWTQVEPGIWSETEDNELRLGVQWADLEPPQEPEAVFLPQPAQILDSEAVTLNWGRGRRFDVQVYAEESPGGDDLAPVEAMETHVLIVTPMAGERRVIDVYIRATSAVQLESLEPILQHTLTSVVVEE